MSDSSKVRKSPCDPVPCSSLLCIRIGELAFGSQPSRCTVPSARADPSAGDGDNRRARTSARENIERCQENDKFIPKSRLPGISRERRHEERAPEAEKPDGERPAPAGQLRPSLRAASGRKTGRTRSEPGPRLLRRPVETGQSSGESPPRPCRLHSTQSSEPTGWENQGGKDQ